MKLRDLIAALKAQPPGDFLRIDRSPVSLTPVGVDSYRGYYEQLAIMVEAKATMRVGSFVELLESKIDTVMEGYKGGEYNIDPMKEVWISNYGEASGSRVTGVRRAEWNTYLTWTNDYE